jgi:hypothetical protein
MLDYLTKFDRQMQVLESLIKDPINVDLSPDTRKELINTVKDIQDDMRLRFLEHNNKELNSLAGGEPPKGT